MNRNRDKCECCTDAIGWIWNADTNSAEACPLCNPGRDENLIDAHLKRGEATGVQTGNAWLRDLCRKKRQENRAQKTEKPGYVNRPPQFRNSGRRIF